MQPRFVVAVTGVLTACTTLLVGASAESARAVASGVVAPVQLTGPGSVVDESTVALNLARAADTGEPVGGVVHVVQRTTGAWVPVADVPLDATGHGQLVVAPRQTTQYVATADTDGVHDASSSAVLTVVNLPNGPVPTMPRRAPRPAGLPAQDRAVGGGANVVVTDIPDDVWGAMTGRSWHPGCPVGRDGLRLIRLNYWGFDGYRHRGELVVNAAATRNFVGAFTELYQRGFPIRGVYRPDRFGYSRRSGGADDYAAMRHDNTSAFNCRWVTGNPGVRSPHSYGFALDLNTWENPYHSKRGWLPNRWWVRRSDARYAWRSVNAPVVRLMRAHGFRWTYGRSDTQHFDAVAGAGSRTGPADPRLLPLPPRLRRNVLD